MTSHNERAEMNNRTAKHRIIMALCCMFALMLATIGLSAPAATAATAAEGSLTVTYQYQEAALNNADISLYRLADWSAKGGYMPTGDLPTTPHTRWIGIFSTPTSKPCATSPTPWPGTSP